MSDKNDSILLYLLKTAHKELPTRKEPEPEKPSTPLIAGIPDIVGYPVVIVVALCSAYIIWEAIKKGIYQLGG